MDEERTTTDEATDTERLVERVRERYGRIAREGGHGCGCGAGATLPEASASQGLGYQTADLATVPQGADLGLGCGVPIPFLALRPGETVLDLGSGGGLDAFLAARQVGPAGRVLGVDMTAEMIQRARENAARAGIRNVEFRHGRLEALPVEDGSVDAVTSNCVINLVPDKEVVFREVHRVLRPGGRLVISDVLLEQPLPPAVARDVLAYVGCVSGALLRGDYFAAVTRAGLEEVEILRDVDFLDPGAKPLSDELADLARRCEVPLGDLEGTVRSVTFRAVKRTAGGGAGRKTA